MQRERITITLDRDLLPALDQLVDGGLVRNRSHAIEYALRTGLQVAELDTVFIILGNKFNPSQTLLKGLAVFPIQKVFLVVASAKMTEAQLVVTTCKEFLPTTHVEIVPADFGDGAAILLKQKELSQSFLIIELDALTVSSPNLLRAYTFHRQQLATLTQIVTSEENIYTPSGISFAQSTIANEIPAGLATLQENVFPNLVKGGKVSIYVNT